MRNTSAMIRAKSAERRVVHRDEASILNPKIRMQLITMNGIKKMMNRIGIWFKLFIHIDFLAANPWICHSLVSQPDVARLSTFSCRQACALCCIPDKGSVRFNVRGTWKSIYFRPPLKN